MKKRIALTTTLLLLAACLFAYAGRSPGGWDSFRNLDLTALTAVSYGVSWDESNSSSALTRTGPLVGYPSGNSPGNANLPVHALMRRCILNDSGQVVYYLDASDSTKKEAGGTANLDGTDGQVMVEIPKFYYRYSYTGTTHTWYISLYRFQGYEVHPAFVKNGSEVDYRYIGAYEAWTDGSTKLASVSGQLPTVSQTRATFRTRAANRGTGWRQLDFYLASAVQLLYLVEYADFNTQSVIGNGITDYETWPNGPQALSGNSNSDGNTTNQSTFNTDKWNASTVYSLNDEAIPDASQNGYTYRVTVAGTSAGSEPTWPTTLGNTVVDNTVTWECVRTNQYMSYRGIENIYGHIWKWVDGININNNIPYVANTDTEFADDTTTNYTRLTDTGGGGITLHNADGWQTTLEQTKGGFLPSAVGGSSSTYITDYYYQNSGWRVARLGAGASDGSNAGAFYWSLYYASSYSSSTVGGRLCF